METKTITGIAVLLILVISPFLVPGYSVCTGDKFTPTNYDIIYYCSSRDIYRACSSLSSTNKTCYHMDRDEVKEYIAPNLLSYWESKGNNTIDKINEWRSNNVTLEQLRNFNKLAQDYEKNNNCSFSAGTCPSQQ